jgi:hypothetical protein
MTDAQKALWARLDAVFAYIERLGYCVATGATGAAIIYYRAVVLPMAPTLIGILGMAVVAAAFPLTVFATAHFVLTNFSKSRKSAVGIVTAIALSVALAFLLVGFQIAAANFKSSTPPSAQQHGVTSRSQLPAPAAAGSTLPDQNINQAQTAPTQVGVDAQPKANAAQVPSTRSPSRAPSQQTPR